jgi:hypothetical protein
VVSYDDLEHPTQELGDHVSSGHQKTATMILSTQLKNSATTFQAVIRKTSYEKSDRRSNATTNQDFIDDYPIIRVSPH